MLVNILKIIFILSISSAAGLVIEVKEGTFETVDGVVYYFGKEKVTWYEALAKCRLVGGFLASIDERREASILSHHLLDYYGRKIWWLSGADFDQTGNLYWYGTGHALSHLAWYKDQPVNYRYHENCVRFRNQGIKYGIENRACNTTSRYICEFEKPKTEVNGELEGQSVSFEKVGEKFYYLSEETSTWHKAYLSCRSKGSNLASINDSLEMKELSDHLVKRNSSLPRWWLSGAKLTKDSNLVWYGSGKNFTYTNWSEFLISELENPNRCVKLWYEDSEYKMTVYPCNVELNYICEVTVAKTL